MKGLLVAIEKPKKPPPKKAKDPARVAAMRELRAAMAGDDDDALAEALQNAVTICRGPED